MYPIFTNVYRRNPAICSPKNKQRSRSQEHETTKHLWSKHISNMRGDQSFFLSFCWPKLQKKSITNMYSDHKVWVYLNVLITFPWWTMNIIFLQESKSFHVTDKRERIYSVSNILKSLKRMQKKKSAMYSMCYFFEYPVLLITKHDMIIYRMDDRYKFRAWWCWWKPIMSLAKHYRFVSMYLCVFLLHCRHDVMHFLEIVIDTYTTLYFLYSIVTFKIYTLTRQW